MKKNTRSTSTKKGIAAEVSKNATFPIVAIGSSAGGLEAISLLLKHLPCDTGMAFIYVQHLSPEQKSLTKDLLTRQTRMKVQEIQQMVLIKPDNLYVIPNNKNIEVTNGHIRLITREKKVQKNLSADTLFISLAQTHSDDIIGVVLSGNASDGTQGLRAIKSQGGITFAQDDSAKNKSMPQSAVTEGVVDFVMSPKQIALSLGRLGKFFKTNGSLHTPRNEKLNDADLKSILSLVYEYSGVDFSLYKVNTIQRRVLRRIMLSEVKDISRYISLLSNNTKELETLQADLLINFTNFFRDKETFDYLKKKLLPKLLKNRTSSNPLRLWVVGCSTGEEAYSLAMIMHEILGKEPARGQIQIFATDLSAASIKKARAGLFTKTELQPVSRQRLSRFFAETPQGYQITKSVREMCVFAAHNVLTEPPFSRLDVICCCNMLIYLDVAAQQKVMSTFHYSLKDSGYLVLGKSETVGSSGFLFAQHQKNIKIFIAKKHSSKPPLTELRNKPLQRQRAFALKTDAKKSIVSIPFELERQFESILLERFFPSCVVINSNYEIVLFRGKTSAYLENGTGKASLNILKMAKTRISFDLRNLIYKATSSKVSVKSSPIEVSRKTGRSNLVIEVVPFVGLGDELFFIVLFFENALGVEHAGQQVPLKEQAKIKTLAGQISKIKSDMLMMMKNHEGSTQELQSANEEIVSSNEELQSLNEELETSREEIESTNEELNATIQELLAQNQLLAESYRYSEDIIATLHEPMIVLDHELNVKTANAAFYSMFKLKADAVEGQSFYKLDNHRWAIQKLRILLGKILLHNSSFQAFPVTLSLSRNKEINLLLNAKKINQKGHKKSLILLAMAEVN